MAEKDTWLEMLDSLVTYAEKAMRHEGARLQAARESGQSSEDVRAFDIEATRAQAVMNMLMVVRDKYVTGKEKGKVWPDIEQIILSGLSAYRQMAAEWQKEQAA